MCVCVCVCEIHNICVVTYACKVVKIEILHRIMVGKWDHESYDSTLFEEKKNKKYTLVC